LASTSTLFALSRAALGSRSIDATAMMVVSSEVSALIEER